MAITLDFITGMIGWSSSTGGAAAGGTFDFMDGTDFQFMDGTYFDFMDA